MDKFLVITNWLWGCARPLTTMLLFRIGWGVLFSAPLLANLSSTLETSENIPQALLNLLDGNDIEMPLNMMRLFWSSAALVLAAMIYNLTASSKLQVTTFDEWKNSSRAKALKQYIKLQRTNISPGQLEAELKDRYENRDLLLEILRLVPLIAVYALQGIAVFLFGFIVFETICLMAQQSTFSELFTF